MDKAFQLKIIEEIDKSGFPLELELVEILRRQNILTFPNLTFLDKAGVVHELDIISIISNEKNEWKHGPCGIQLVIECKKTEKYPWIFFEEVNDPLHLMGKLHNIDYSTDFVVGDLTFNPLYGSMNTKLAGHHFNDRNIPYSKAYFEAFKKPTEQTTIYKAVNNIFSGKQYLKKSFMESKTKDKTKGRTFLNQYCIVLEGQLILATKNKKNFEVKEVQHISLNTFDTMESKGSKLLSNEITIDIVRKDFFSDYVSILKKDANLFNIHLKKLDRTGLDLKL